MSRCRRAGRRRVVGAWNRIVRNLNGGRRAVRRSRKLRFFKVGFADIEFWNIGFCHINRSEI